MKKRIALSLLLLLTAGIVFAQESKRDRKKRYGKKNTELVELNGRYKLSGWHFAPGLVYTLTRFNDSEETFTDANSNSYDATVNPGGKFGLYLEAGRYRIFKYGVLFNYMDYSLAYKAVKGTEAYSGNLTGDNTATFSGDGYFKHKYILGNINFNNVLPLSSRSFLQNSLGFNVDYSIINKEDYNNTPPFGFMYDPSRLLAQLHYKIGYGFKLNNGRWFIIPTLETPILNLFEWDKFKSTDPMYNSRYRPVILTIRFAWLRKSDPTDCLTPDNPGDKDKQKLFDLEK